METWDQQETCAGGQLILFIPKVISSEPVQIILLNGVVRVVCSSGAEPFCGYLASDIFFADFQVDFRNKLKYVIKH